MDNASTLVMQWQKPTAAVAISPTVNDPWNFLSGSPQQLPSINKSIMYLMVCGISLMTMLCHKIGQHVWQTLSSVAVTVADPLTTKLGHVT